MSEAINYVIDERFHTSVKRSKRVIEIAEAFGLGLDDKEFVVFDKIELPVKDGDIIYITGQSGGGKSVLLRNLMRQMKERDKKVVNLDEIKFDPDTPVIDQIGTDTKEALRLLSIAGLNDAFSLFACPHQLSDGQRYRFKIAKAIETGAQVWTCDEFLAILDRTSAKIIAYSIQKVARAVGATLMVATTHQDLADDLAPDLVVQKRFGEKVLIERIADAQKLVEQRNVTRDELQTLLTGTRHV